MNATSSRWEIPLRCEVTAIDQELITVANNYLLQSVFKHFILLISFYQYLALLSHL